MTEWWESLVQLQTADSEMGSGIFLSPTVVVTAAHVVTHSGIAFDPTAIEVFVRFQSRSLKPTEVLVLPDWRRNQSPESDVALLRVPSSPGLGVRPAFGLPPASASAMLEAAGFDVKDDELKHCAGRVRCEATVVGELLLFSDDIKPVPGMSGGPVYAATPHGVRVAGIVTQLTKSKFFGVALVSDVLASLGFGSG